MLIEGVLSEARRLPPHAPVTVLIGRRCIRPLRVYIQLFHTALLYGFARFSGVRSNLREQPLRTQLYCLPFKFNLSLLCNFCLVSVPPKTFHLCLLLVCIFFYLSDTTHLFPVSLCKFLIVQLIRFFTLVLAVVWVLALCDSLKQLLLCTCLYTGPHMHVQLCAINYSSKSCQEAYFY